MHELEVIYLGRYADHCLICELGKDT